jgi:hypothetical protein
MNCVELQQSLAEVEDGSRLDQRTHLRTCPVCSSLFRELQLIATAANELQAANEPSPRVWNSIEIALRQEGLIRPQRRDRPVLSSFGARWGAARWLAPAAAMLLLAVGLYVRRELLPKPVTQAAVVAPMLANASDLNDEDLMQEVASDPPAMKTQYAENLLKVNESIRDAQGAVDESPNDPDARRLLMDAYQQKSMLFEMAMDRSGQ